MLSRLQRSLSAGRVARKQHGQTFSNSTETSSHSNRSVILSPETKRRVLQRHPSLERGRAAELKAFFQHEHL